MADRKRKKKQAIQESVEMSAPPKKRARRVTESPEQIAQTTPYHPDAYAPDNPQAAAQKAKKKRQLADANRRAAAKSKIKPIPGAASNTETKWYGTRDVNVPPPPKASTPKKTRTQHMNDAIAQLKETGEIAPRTTRGIGVETASALLKMYTTKTSGKDNQDG